MKNSCFKSRFLSVCVFLAMSAGTVQGQYSSYYYHRVGDTVFQDSPIYYHQWWNFGTENEQGFPVGSERLNVGHNNNIDSVMQYFYTPDTLKVLGLAMLRPIFFNATTVDPNAWPYNDSTPVQESIFLYEATPSQLVKLGEVPWNLRRDPHRTIAVTSFAPTAWLHPGVVIPYTEKDNPCCAANKNTIYREMYEYYFDSAVFVHDSFYVGGTNLSDYYYNGQYYNAIAYMTFSNNMGWYCNCDGDSSYSLNTDSYTHRQRMTDTVCILGWPSMYYENSLGWLYMPYDNHVFTIFPIVQVDTTVLPDWVCGTVSNVRIVEDDTGCVTIFWDAGYNNVEYDIMYGQSITPESQWTMVTTNQTMIQLCDLTPRTIYKARIRAHCPDGIFFRQHPTWSEMFNVIRYNFPQGIEGPSQGAHVSLSPNPASNSLTVVADYGLLAVDIYDLSGRHLLNIPAFSTTATIDITSLPTGYYIATVTTPREKTSHSFTVK